MRTVLGTEQGPVRGIGRKCGVRVLRASASQIRPNLSRVPTTQAPQPSSRAPRRAGSRKARTRCGPPCRGSAARPPMPPNTQRGRHARQLTNQRRARPVAAHSHLHAATQLQGRCRGRQGLHHRRGEFQLVCLSRRQPCLAKFQRECNATLSPDWDARNFPML